jgi:O-antigen/teichoic acid export membrane protein
VLIRQTFAYLPAQLLSPLIQLGAALLLTHALGAADYGLVMLIFAGQELVFLACLSWWTTFYLRFGGRFVPADDPRALASTEAAVLLLSSVAQVAVTVLIIVLTEPGLPLAFYAAACAFTLTRSLLNFLGERARREAAIASYTAVQVIGPLGGLALVGLLMLADATSPARVLAAFALTQGLVGLAVAGRFGLLVRPRKLDHAVLREARRFGAPVVLANMLSWLGGNVIRFVVHHGAGPVALGLMSVGWGLATRLSGVAAMLVAAAAYPLAVKAMEAGDVDGARGQLAANSSLLLLLLAPAGLAFWVLAPWLVTWLVAAEYHEVTLQILPWALLGACVRNLRLHGWDQTYLLFAATRDMVWLDVMEAIVMTLAAVIGLWWGGVVGAVEASAWAAIGLALLDGWWLRRRFGLVLPLGVYARVLAAALAMALLLHGLLQLPPLAAPAAPVGGLVAAAAASGLAYLGLLAALFPGHTRGVFSWLRQRAGA